MAAGLPVVANPVGMNREMVLHGQTGFLAGTREEWAQAVAMLAADPRCEPGWELRGVKWSSGHYSVQPLGSPFRFARREPGRSAPSTSLEAASHRTAGDLRSRESRRGGGVSRRSLVWRVASAGVLAAAALMLYGCTGMIEQPTALPAQFDRLRPIDDL